MKFNCTVRGEDWDWPLGEGDFKPPQIPWPPNPKVIEAQLSGTITCNGYYGLVYQEDRFELVDFFAGTSKAWAISGGSTIIGGAVTGENQIMLCDTEKIYRIDLNSTDSDKRDAEINIVSAWSTAYDEITAIGTMANSQGNQAVFSSYINGSGGALFFVSSSGSNLECGWSYYATEVGPEDYIPYVAPGGGYWNGYGDLNGNWDYNNGYADDIVMDGCITPTGLALPFHHTLHVFNNTTHDVTTAYKLVTLQGSSLSESVHFTLPGLANYAYYCGTVYASVLAAVHGEQGEPLPPLYLCHLKYLSKIGKYWEVDGYRQGWIDPSIYTGMIDFLSGSTWYHYVYFGGNVKEVSQFGSEGNLISESFLNTNIYWSPDTSQYGSNYQSDTYSWSIPTGTWTFAEL